MYFTRFRFTDISLSSIVWNIYHPFHQSTSAISRVLILWGVLWISEMLIFKIVCFVEKRKDLCVKSMTFLLTEIQNVVAVYLTF